MKYKIKYESFEINDGGGQAVCRPETAFNILKEKFNYCQEEFYILILDIKNRVINTKMIYRGCGSNIYIDPRDIFRTVLLLNGQNFISNKKG